MAPKSGAVSRKEPSEAQRSVGRWTQDEKLLFLHGLHVHGRGRWKKIRQFLPTRTLVQIKSHAQKVLKREEAGEDILRPLVSEKDRVTALLQDASYSSEALSRNLIKTVKNFKPKGAVAKEEPSRVHEVIRSPRQLTASCTTSDGKFRFTISNNDIPPRRGPPPIYKATFGAHHYHYPHHHYSHVPPHGIHFSYPPPSTIEHLSRDDDWSSVSSAAHSYMAQEEALYPTTTIAPLHASTDSVSSLSTVASTKATCVTPDRKTLPPDVMPAVTPEGKSKNYVDVMPGVTPARKSTKHPVDVMAATALCQLSTTPSNKRRKTEETPLLVSP